MKSETINLKVSSHPENLKRIRCFMSDITLKAKLSKQDCASVVLAVDEACSNIIKHSYKNDFNKKIDLVCKLESNLLTISIFDNGLKFDINSIDIRDLNEIKPGGLGIYITKKIMDKVEYSHTPEGRNKIMMTKKLKD